MIEASGTFRLSDEGRRRTSRLFGRIMAANDDVFTRYFGRPLVHGSVNLTVTEPPKLMDVIRDADVAPDIVIPRSELTGVPGRRIGGHRFWTIRFTTGKVLDDVPCWLMRKEGTGLSADHHEVLSTVHLRSTYSLRHGDPFTLTVVGSDPDEEPG